MWALTHGIDPNITYLILFFAGQTIIQTLGILQNQVMYYQDNYCCYSVTNILLKLTGFAHTYCGWSYQAGKAPVVATNTVPYQGEAGGISPAGEFLITSTALSNGWLAPTRATSRHARQRSGARFQGPDERAGPSCPASRPSTWHRLIGYSFKNKKIKGKKEG